MVLTDRQREDANKSLQGGEVVSRIVGKRKEEEIVKNETAQLF